MGEGRKEGRTDSPLVDYPLYAAAAFSSSPFHHYSDRLYPPRNARGGRFLRAKCAITTDRTNKAGRFLVLQGGAALYVIQYKSVIAWAISSTFLKNAALKCAEIIAKM